MDELFSAGYLKRTLEARKVSTQITLPGEFMIDQADLDAFTSCGIDSLVLRLTSAVLSDQLVSESREVTVEVPSSWWQMLKRDVLLRYGFLRGVIRSPVKVTTMTNLVHFERYRTYPEADVVLPKGKYGSPVYLEVLTQGGWRL